MKTFEEALEKVVLSTGNRADEEEDMLRMQDEYHEEINSSPLVAKLADGCVETIWTMAIKHSDVNYRDMLLSIFVNGFRLGVCTGIQMERP